VSAHCKSPTACPSDAQLVAFNTGKSGFGELETISNCVQDCPRCIERLEELKTDPDLLIRGLRQPPPTDAPENQCQDLVAKIEAFQVEPALIPTDQGSEFKLAALQTPPKFDSNTPIVANLPFLQNQLNTLGGRETETVMYSEDDMKKGALEKRKKALLGGEHLIGTIIGEYKIVSLLGAGGMGQVFKAVHQRMERTVAVKVLPGEAVGSRDAVARFHREVKAAAKLAHPNIVHAYDAGELEEMLYLVMEYVEGNNLEKLVQKQGTLSVVEALDTCIQAAKGFHQAHEQGIVHRDIKPANLIRDTTGTVKILDMGLALIKSGPEDNGRRLTQAGTLLGTIDYMAPEQALDVKNADRRADIYSLGCTLYFMLVGRPPFQWENILEAVMAHNTKPIPSLRAARREVSPTLDKIYMKMLAKDPNDRYQTMTEVIADLEKARAQALLGGGPGISPQMILIVGGAVLGVLALGGIIYGIIANMQ